MRQTEAKQKICIVIREVIEDMGGRGREAPVGAAEPARVGLRSGSCLAIWSAPGAFLRHRGHLSMLH